MGETRASVRDNRERNHLLVESTAAKRGENPLSSSLNAALGQLKPRKRNNADSQKKSSSQNTKLLKVIPLGGLDGIGKNMTVFEYGNEIILVDAGLMFPDDDHPGVDLILPDYSYVIQNADRLRAIIITHGHEDHTGSLPYLLKDLERDVPILGTKLTLGLIEGKLAEHRIKKQRFREILPGSHISIGAFGFDFFSVNHSIPAAVGVFIRTPGGNVLHTGDFKLDQTPIDGVLTDFAAISHFAKVGVDLMLSDSTNATNPNFTRSEAEVGKALRQIISSAPQRVIVASFSSHIHRVQQICDAAVAAGRKVAVTGRSMLTNSKIARELGYLNIDENNIIDAYSAKDIPAEKVVILCTGSQGEPLSALARMANGEHRTVSIEEGDVVIISATPVPGNEKAVTRVVNALSKIGARIYDKKNALVHVSGHAGAEELKLMIALAQPRYFVPIHGEAQHLRAHVQLAHTVGIPEENTFILDNGDCLLLEEGKARRGESVENGIVYVDGLSVGDVSAVVLKDRQTLANEGIVTVVSMIRKRDSSLVGKPEIIMRGVSAGEDPELLADAIATAERVIINFSHENRSNPNSLKRAIRESISSLLWERCRRRPMIIPIIMDV
ncbi:MAG: ribonuclease J [Coriobacteriaceae bacterium]|nr:ribonuclease J [Coriobacteriaceae bacterium]